jgi:hypothetical protein
VVVLNQWGIPDAIQPHRFRTATDSVETFDVSSNVTWPEYRLVLAAVSTIHHTLESRLVEENSIMTDQGITRRQFVRDTVAAAAAAGLTATYTVQAGNAARVSMAERLGVRVDEGAEFSRTEV